MNLKSLFASTAVLACFCATTASASTDLAVTGWAGGHQNICINGGGLSSSLHVAAGPFTAQADGNSFVAWCFDILHKLNFSSTTYKYETTTSPFGFNGGFSSDKLSDLGKLFNTAYASLGGLGQRLLNAAFQVAIWEIGFETCGQCL